MEQQLSKAEQERLARQSVVKKRKLKTALTWIVILVLAGAGIYYLFDRAKVNQVDKPGIEYPDIGNRHVDPGVAHDPYNSNPPTSGPHYPQPAPWGVYADQRPDEELIHNLEHGGIWISYKDPGDQALIDQLKDIADNYPIKVIMTPRPGNDSRIAVAAWTRLLPLEAFDQGQIKNFIKAYINKGPEQVPY